MELWTILAFCLSIPVFVLIFCIFAYGTAPGPENIENGSGNENSWFLHVYGNRRDSSTTENMFFYENDGNCINDNVVLHNCKYYL